MYFGNCEGRDRLLYQHLVSHDPFVIVASRPDSLCYCSEVVLQVCYFSLHVQFAFICWLLRGIVENVGNH